MKRALLLKNASQLLTRKFLISPPQILSSQPHHHHHHLNLNLGFIPTISLRSFSSDSSDDQNPNPNPPANDASPTTVDGKVVDVNVEDVSNQELKSRIEKYFKGDEEALPSILEAILARKLVGTHEDTDDELTEELRHAPVGGVDDDELESDFEDGFTDEELEDLCSAKDIVVKRLMDDEYFNMDSGKWDDIVQEATEQGLLRDMTECEEILEDMQNWDKLLPDDIKKKVSAKLDELGDLCESKQLEPEEAYEQYKVFEDKIVAEHIAKLEEEKPQESDEVAKPVDKKSDDPPGVGPVLRWQSRVVFVHGGEAWHPKNRKVKMSVTVKELGLSRYQFRRLREIVGKRYHPGKDELTITSERFEHREENKKDCLRTLLSIIEEAGKADALVDEARTSYVKQRLKANSAFMSRLQVKMKKAPAAIPA